jgi:hypothetical protein
MQVIFFACCSVSPHRTVFNEGMSAAGSSSMTYFIGSAFAPTATHARTHARDDEANIETAIRHAAPFLALHRRALACSPGGQDRLRPRLFVPKAAHTGRRECRAASKHCRRRSRICSETNDDSRWAAQLPGC